MSGSYQYPSLCLPTRKETQRVDDPEQHGLQQRGVSVEKNPAEDHWAPEGGKVGHQILLDEPSLMDQDKASDDCID